MHTKQLKKRIQIVNVDKNDRFLMDILADFCIISNGLVWQVERSFRKYVTKHWLWK